VILGSKELTQKQTERTVTNIGSSIGSLNGNVTIAAGNDYTQQGSQIAAAGDIDITAQRIDIGAAKDGGQSQSETTFKQSGLSIAVSSPLIDSLINVAQQAEATAKVKDKRFQAMGAMNTAMAGMGAASALGNAAGSNPGQGASVSLAITVGSSQSESKQTQSGTTAVGSTLQAGNNITLAATGDGKDSHLNVSGSDIAVTCPDIFGPSVI
jgi:filamentous hemagglutinin